MAEIKWGAAGQRRFETGVDHGALYVRDAETGEYPDGVAWVGLTTVTESPSGAESNKQYADNRVYANLRSKEEFAGTIEAFTYPDEFEVCDGSREVAPGVTATQQNRVPFGFSYRSLIGNDVKSLDLGYKLHLVWGATASPSEKARATLNDSPEAAAFSWEFETDPVELDAVVDGVKLNATAHFIIDSTRTTAAKMKAIEDILYGRGGTTPPRLPLPEEVIELLGDGTSGTASISSFDESDDPAV